MRRIEPIRKPSFMTDEQFEGLLGECMRHLKGAIEVMTQDEHAGITCHGCKNFAIILAISEPAVERVQQAMEGMKGEGWEGGDLHMDFSGSDDDDDV